MANLKEVRNRISSVKSTQQITKAMKMVAAAKLRRAQDRTVQLRPYAHKLNEILQKVIASSSDGLQSSVFSEVREVKSVLLVVVTSDRGLCGGFNSNVFKAAKALVAKEYAEQEKAGNLHIMCIGKRGRDHFTKRAYNTDNSFAELFASLTFENARDAAEKAMQAFSSGKVDKVVLVYNEFKNVATQILRTDNFLPLSGIEASGTEEAAVSEYIYEPERQQIIDDILPKALKIKFYGALLESNASENGARMTAMGQATDNADEMLKALRLTYNRSRQAVITKEILEIVGGAEALAQG